MQVGDLIRKPDQQRPREYGVIVEIHGGDMAKVIWQGLDGPSWEMLHNLVDAAQELTVFRGQLNESR